MSNGHTKEEQEPDIEVKVIKQEDDVKQEIRKQEFEMKQECSTCFEREKNKEPELIVANGGLGVLCLICQKHFFYVKYLQEHLDQAHATLCFGYDWKRAAHFSLSAPDYRTKLFG